MPTRRQPSNSWTGAAMMHGAVPKHARYCNSRCPQSLHLLPFASADPMGFELVGVPDCTFNTFHPIRPISSALRSHSLTDPVGPSEGNKSASGCSEGHNSSKLATGVQENPPVAGWHCLRPRALSLASRIDAFRVLSWLADSGSQITHVKLQEIYGSCNFPSETSM